MTRHNERNATSETRAPLDEDGSPRAKRRGGSPFAAVADANAFAPGAPARSERGPAHSTTFLVGAYAKYDRPYAWVRSGPLSGQDDAAEQDTPLDLECTKNWEEGAHRAWDVVEELVRMRVFPAPANAFEVNHFALRHVPRDDRYLLTGALVAFLRDVAADEGAAATRRRHGNGDKNAFDAAVTRDVEKLVARHFADVPERLRRAYT